MRQIFHPNYVQFKEELYQYTANFSSLGTQFIKAERNSIKTFPLHETTINIKYFKIPNLLNKIAYKYFRDSKARRSFENGIFLLEKGIGTPHPIAYFEDFNLLGIKKSYYISEHLEYDLTFRELNTMQGEERDIILKQFTKFCYKLHEKGIEFKDHSPGNTLIKKRTAGTYDFYLVDLNRMDFHNDLSFNLRLKNLSRLTPHKEIVEIISHEYALLYNKPYKAVFEKLWEYTEAFQRKYWRKKKLKNKLKLK